jgi:hypothetical protein
MTKHLAKSDFTGSALKLVAVPAPGEPATYQRLTDIELAAYGLWRRVLAYSAVPAFPVNEDVRQRRMALIEESIADMRKALGDA